jgi:pyruvate/2-oxoglutarate dehydrogenase complex dihydrolipoamide acyltransferase (E2) component
MVKKKTPKEPGAAPTAPAAGGEKKKVRSFAERQAALAREQEELASKGRERAAGHLKRAKMSVDKATNSTAVDLSALQQALTEAIEAVEAPTAESEAEES